MTGDRPARTVQAGEELGPYRIVRELGSGGMGSVFEATDGDGMRVALKVVHPHLLGQAGFRERFLREVAVGRRIDHPNVIRTLDAGEFGGEQGGAGGRNTGRPYIVLEFVTGQTLHDLRTELGRVPETLCRHIGVHAARGLGAIHAQGIVHRDIKPDNILITPDHEIKLMDLGLARDAAGDERMTRTGQFVGSPAYAPPEQFAGTGTLDARSDLYSLGVTLYELATGVRPFKANSLEALALQILQGKPPRPGSLCTQISPFLEEVLLALLQRDPAQRIATAMELCDLLEMGERAEWWVNAALRIHERTQRPLRRIRIPRESDCLGRDDELKRLRSAYDQARAGEGSVLLLSGEAGIGKSRLIDELMRLLEADGEDVNFLYGSYPPGGAATATGAFSSAFREQFGRGGCESYLPETPLLVPAFDALLRGDGPPPGAAPLTSDSLKTVFVHATRALGRERPTIIVIDDLHFAPDEGRALFASLAMAVEGQRVLLIGSARPDLSKDWRASLERLEHVSRIDVPRLGIEHVTHLLKPILGASPHAAQLSQTVARTAGGNPFFLFEIVRSLRETNALSQNADGSWATTSRITAIEIPATVQSLLDARIARLTNEEREIVECAACWGQEFDGRLVADALGLRQLPALRSLGRLEQEHSLVRSAGGAFVFDHHATQEHLYARLSGPVREATHAELARALEEREHAADRDPESLPGALCLDLCEHFLKGARGDQAVRYLVAAQTHLSRAYLNAPAAALTERALAVPGLLTGHGRVRALLRLTSSLDRMGQRARQEECAREAQSLADSAGDNAESALLRGQAANALGRLLQMTARREESEAAFRRALECALAAGDRRAEADAMGHLGGVVKDQGRLAEAREIYERQHSLSHAIGYLPSEGSASGNLGLMLWFDGRLGEAGALMERALVLARESGDRRNEAVGLGNLGMVHQARGLLPEARAHYERSLTLCRELGDRLAETAATGNLGGVLRIEGRLREARAHYDLALALAREIGQREFEAVILFDLGAILRELGDDAAADETLTTCLARCETFGIRHAAASAHYALGSARAARCRAARGGSEADDAAARASLVAARRVAQEIGMIGVETGARCTLALLRGGDPADAVLAFTEAEARLTADERRAARYVLWQATGDSAHLHEAKRLLDELVATVSPATRQAMLTHSGINRDILNAWRATRGESAASGSDDDGGDDKTRCEDAGTRVNDVDPGDSEAETSIGAGA